MVRGGVHVHFLPFGDIAVLSGIDKETDDSVEGVKSCLEGDAVHGVAQAYGGAKARHQCMLMHGGVHEACQFLLGVSSPIGSFFMMLASSMRMTRELEAVSILPAVLKAETD
jgi:hypothetical protein